MKYLQENEIILKFYRVPEILNMILYVYMLQTFVKILTSKFICTKMPVQ